MIRAIRITLDEKLLVSVNEAAKKLKMTRSAFMRKTLREALNHLATSKLEQKHRRGYEQRPVHKREFDIWEKEQVWPDS